MQAHSPRAAHRLVHSLRGELVTETDQVPIVAEDARCERFIDAATSVVASTGCPSTAAASTRWLIP